MFFEKLTNSRREGASAARTRKFSNTRLDSNLGNKYLRTCGGAASLYSLPDSMFGEVHCWFIAVFTEETY